MFFGANIKYLRTLRGMSQAELGLHMHVTPSTIAGWESGKSSPHFDVLLRLRELFQVDLESLVYRDLQHEATLGNVSLGLAAKIVTLEKFEALVERVSMLEKKINDMQT